MVSILSSWFNCNGSSPFIGFFKLISNFYSLMNPVFIVIFSILFLIANFLEYIVYNEEILLTFCFLSFIFFFYHYVQTIVQSSFDSQFESIKQNYFDALKSRYDFILSHNLNLKLLINLTQKLHVYEILHKFYAFSTINMITNDIIVSTKMEFCGKELDNEVKSKKNQITNLLLTDMFANLVCNALEAKYYSKTTTLSKLGQANNFSKSELLNL